jgi:hypothetical protein
MRRTETIVTELQHDPRDLVARAEHTPETMATTPTPADCLDDGVLAIDACGSLFLFDLVHARFQRLPRGSDAARAVRYGRWLALRELVLDADGTFTVEPGEGGGPRVRSHAHGAGCGCRAETSTSAIAG